ncbi:hypothetical protein BDR26DRAFT_15739 [Obelidium mucronatum]|nr:hypothetical protein BDR26DRAFT_15739 [Obelidium mucronatum]
MDILLKSGRSIKPLKECIGVSDVYGNAILENFFKSGLFENRNGLPDPTTTKANLPTTAATNPAKIIATITQAARVTEPSRTAIEPLTDKLVVIVQNKPTANSGSSFNQIQQSADANSLEISRGSMVGIIAGAAAVFVLGVIGAVAFLRRRNQQKDHNRMSKGSTESKEPFIPLETGTVSYGTYK